MTDDDTVPTHVHGGPEPVRPAPRGRERGRSSDSRSRIEELAGDDQAFVLYFKERVYATYTGLAIVLVVQANEHPEASHAFLALVLGVFAIVMAGFVSDVIAHLSVHQDLPSGREFAILIRIALGALGTLLVPAGLILLAWLEIIPLIAALRASWITYVVTLAVIGWFAVRRSKLQWWKQLLVLLVLVALGLAVVLVQTIAHSV